MQCVGITAPQGLVLKSVLGPLTITDDSAWFYSDVPSFIL